MPSTRHCRRANNPEAGFVMLLVFVMAAVLAISLYMELPRVAFEAQRNTEGLLIERGEQYQRGIQLYFRKFKRYPTSIEQLESTNNVRFLRRRYIDPLTGKDEWRLIHIGPTGNFIDSLTHKPNQGSDKDKKDQNTFITEGGGIGSSVPTGGANGQPARRASDQAALTAALNSQADPNTGQPATNVFANQVAGQGGYSAGIGSSPPTGIPPGVTPVSAFNLPAQTATPGVSPDGTTQAPSQQSGFGSSQGQGFGSSSGFGQSSGQGFGGSSGFGQSAGQGFGQSANPAGIMSGQQGDPSQAANLMLNQLLTTPRNNFVTPGPGLGTTAVGGGIAGVASTVERTGIKIYNDRNKYNEWEFIYDFGKDRTGMGQMAGQMGSADPRLANSGQSAGFGSQGGIGQGSANQGGFGQSGFGTQAGGQQAGFGGIQSGFGQPASSAPGNSGGIGSSAGGVGSGYGGGIGAGLTPPPTAQPATPAQPVRQPANPQQSPTTNQPAQPVQPPQAAPPPPPAATPPAQEPEPAPPPPPAADPPPR